MSRDNGNQNFHNRNYARRFRLLVASIRDHANTLNAIVDRLLDQPLFSLESIELVLECRDNIASSTRRLNSLLDDLDASDPIQTP